LYRKDRTEGQKWSIYLGVEKAGMAEQLKAWFGWDMGLPLVALGGYASQTLVDKVRDDILKQQRPAVLIYGGDHDPTGVDIDRDFERRVRYFKRVVRVALSPEQVEEHALPFNSDPEVMKKLGDDPRAKRFEERFGSLVQYELDALPPEVLRDLYQSAIDDYWDGPTYKRVLRREVRDVSGLEALDDAVSLCPKKRRRMSE
jgi:hypothetical protein